MNKKKDVNTEIKKIMSDVAGTNNSETMEILIKKPDSININRISSIVYRTVSDEMSLCSCESDMISHVLSNINKEGIMLDYISLDFVACLTSLEFNYLNSVAGLYEDTLDCYKDIDNSKDKESEVC